MSTITKTVPVVNEEFVSLINWGTDWMPKISKFGVFGVYLISALVMGAYHVDEVSKISGASMVIKYSPLFGDLGVQFIRCICVFFALNSPIFINEARTKTRIVAFVLMALSCYDAYILFSPHSFSFTITMLSLMLGGYIVEIGLLKEIERTCSYLILQDKNFEKNLTNYYQGLQRIEHIKRTAKRSVFDKDGNIDGYNSGNFFKRAFQSQSKLN